MSQSHSACAVPAVLCIPVTHDALSGIQLLLLAELYSGNVLVRRGVLCLGKSINKKTNSPSLGAFMFHLCVTISPRFQAANF